MDITKIFSNFARRVAHNCLLDLEELTDRQLETIKQKYEELARLGRQDLRRGKADTKNF